MRAARIYAPAKINLGLEILNRRNDGFHEIRTVLATISLSDIIVFSAAEGPNDELHTNPENSLITPAPNLILSALASLRHAGLEIPPQHIELVKCIPIAAGLGGASTDAAATLKYFARAPAISRPELAQIAATLGSDVPFFLDTPFALASGRGEILHSLPSPRPRRWVVTVTPDLRIPRKTATMYDTVKPSCWSSGTDIERFAASFPVMPETIPTNVFALPLYSRYPEIADHRDQLLHLGFPTVMVTGAGPTMFTLTPNMAEAVALSRAATQAIPSATVRISSLGFVSEGAEPRQGQKGT